MLVALIATGCVAFVADTESEPALRMQLQAAHDATLLIELTGHLDAATLARGVREVRAWWSETSVAAIGSVDARGTLSIRMPSIEVHDRNNTPVLHVVDGAGVHWLQWLHLTTASPAGQHDLGELQLQREPDWPVVVDDRGQPLARARVLLSQEYPEDHGLLGLVHYSEINTDERGRTALCRAAPFGGDLQLVVRHEDFAPWRGAPIPLVQLDHGGEIRGRVVLPAGADPGDFKVGLWVAEDLLYPSRFVYADVSAPLATDGTYRMRNVPLGRRTISVQDRLYWAMSGSGVEVDVGAAPVTAPDLTVGPDWHAGAVMRIRFTGHDGRAALGTEATVIISDLAYPVPLHDGYVDWTGDPSEPVAIDVLGYGRTDRRTFHSGEVIRLAGGYHVALRLAIDAAQRLPPGCTLRARVHGRAPDTNYRAPVLYMDGDGAPLPIARDARIVVDAPGRYVIFLELERWDAAEKKFVRAPIDVEPREFEARADSELTLVTVSSRFVAPPR